MQRLRQPAVAGTFYPSDPERLRAMIQGFLATVPRGGTPPKAILAPHAGFIYSGPTAAYAYARLALGRSQIRRVILLGPSHRVAFAGLAVGSWEGFETPLGLVPIDQQGVEALLELPFVQTLDLAHAQEHSLEVQVPFLQETLEDFSLVPVVVGEANPVQVSAAIERLWGGPETAIVISSDLSHYLDYTAANKADRATSNAIEALDPEGIGDDSACGCLPIRGLLMAARNHGLRGETLDVRNSGDTAGLKDHVVGYGAYAFT